MGGLSPQLNCCQLACGVDRSPGLHPATARPYISHMFLWPPQKGASCWQQYAICACCPQRPLPTCKTCTQHCLPPNHTRVPHLTAIRSAANCWMAVPCTGDMPSILPTLLHMRSRQTAPCRITNIIMHHTVLLQKCQYSVSTTCTHILSDHCIYSYTQ